MPATPPLQAAAAAANLPVEGARLLHNRANAVYHLPAADAIVRMRYTRASATWERRLASAVGVAAWLAERRYPTIEPLPIRQQPVTINGWTVTYWQYVNLDADAPWATAADLAYLLRDLHALPDPPVALVPTNPLGSLLDDLAHAEAALTDQQRDWLANRAAAIATAYPTTPMPLGVGLIHGDAHGGNLLAVRGSYLVGDWDSVGYGPRAQDLIPTLDGVRHFGQPRTDWTGLCAAYGIEPGIEDHPGFQLLAQAREIRSLAAYIRAAPGRPDVEAQLNIRLNTLMTGQPAIWHAI